MTTERTTNLHAMRFPDELWKDIVAATKAQGTNTTEITRDFYAWYLRRPGAKMPKRPPIQRPPVGSAPIKVGDLFVVGENDPESIPVYYQVTEVDPDGKWVDTTASIGVTAWYKRWPLPLPDTFSRVTDGEAQEEQSQ